MVRHSSSSSLGGHEYRARSKGRTFLAQHAKSVKHCVANGLQAATVKQLPKRALSEGAKLKNIVQVLPECLRQYNTCSALQRSNKGVSLGIQNKLHSPNEWASWLPSNPKKKLTIHVRRLCCSRAPRAVQQRVPLDRASVTRCSAA